MNPLLSPSPLKHAAVPFDLIRPEHFAPALDAALAHGRARLEQIKIKPASFEITLRGLEACAEELEFVYQTFHNLMSAHGTPELQALAADFGPRVAEFSNDILLDPAVFARVREVYEDRATAGLSAMELRLIEKTYREFETSGANLDDAGKTRLREIDQRWSQLGPKFRQNVLAATNAFELWIEDEAELDGLTLAHKDAARALATERGRPTAWLITLDQSSYTPFLTFAKRRDLRERLYRAHASRCTTGEFSNEAVIRDITTLATEKARLLGHKTYAHLALIERMAETPERVLDFLGKIFAVAKPAAVRDIAEITAFAKTNGGPMELQPWDFFFWSERLKEKTYAFDDAQLRPYLKLENVLDGVFEHARRLFGLEFTLATEYPVYHPDVRVFEVNQVKPAGGKRKFIGLFYADFFPRATKSPGAWMTSYYQQGHFRGERIRPHVSIVCNFTKPTPERPSLLTFQEVRTVFHEFGHALHGLLSDVEFRSLAGTNVYQDFVELPSQLMENWAREEESLKIYARHFETNAVIPSDLIDRLKRSQRYLAGYLATRQLQFGYLDMAYFLSPPGDKESIEEFEARVIEPMRVMPRVPGCYFSTAFAHVFGGGYASGYYSYKWAEALDADAFELFRERGIFDVEAAGRLEEFILSKGGSEHPMRLYEGFRGRLPDPDALLRRDGLVG